MEQYQGGPQDPNNQQGSYQYQQQQQQYQQQQYQQQGYQGGYQNPVDPFKGKAIASMILGIVSLVLFWAGYGALISLACGIIAIVLGSQARKGAENMGIKPNGMATAGLVMGLIGAILSLICFVSCVACVSCYGTALNSAFSDAFSSYMY